MSIPLVPWRMEGQGQQRGWWHCWDGAGRQCCGPAAARPMPGSCLKNALSLWFIRPIPWGRALTNATALPGPGSRGFGDGWDLS